MPTTAVPRVGDRRTEAEATVIPIQYWGRFAMKKPSLWSKELQLEKRAIGKGDAGDRICRRRISPIRFKFIASENLAKLVKGVFLSAVALGLGLPPHSALAPPIVAGLGGKIALAFRRRPKWL